MFISYTFIFQIIWAKLRFHFSTFVIGHVWRFVWEMDHWDTSICVKVMELYFWAGPDIKLRQAFHQEFGCQDAPSQNTILNYIWKFWEEGTVQQTKHERRCTVQTLETTATISANVQQSPKTSTCHLSAYTWVRRTNVRILKTLISSPTKSRWCKKLKMLILSRDSSFLSGYWINMSHITSSTASWDEAHPG
jgi:hypothetical protein